MVPVNVGRHNRPISGTLVVDLECQTQIHWCVSNPAQAKTAASHMVLIQTTIITDATGLTAVYKVQQ